NQCKQQRHRKKYDGSRQITGNDNDMHDLMTCATRPIRQQALPPPFIHQAERMACPLPERNVPSGALVPKPFAKPPAPGPVPCRSGVLLDPECMSSASSIRLRMSSATRSAV